MFKYELRQVVFYMRNNRIHSAPVLARKYIDNVEHKHHSFEAACIEYETCHAAFNEADLFISKDALLEHLRAS